MSEDTLCPLLNMPKTDIRSSKNRHKPSYIIHTAGQRSSICSFVNWRRHRPAKNVDRAHLICRHIYPCPRHDPRAEVDVKCCSKIPSCADCCRPLIISPSHESAPPNSSDRCHRLLYASENVTLSCLSYFSVPAHT